MRSRRSGRPSSPGRFARNLVIGAIAVVGGYFVLRLLYALSLVAVIALVGGQEQVANTASNWAKATVEYQVDIQTSWTDANPVSPDHLLVLVPVPQLDDRPIPAFARAVEAGQADAAARQLIQREQGTFLPLTERDLMEYGSVFFHVEVDTGKRPTTLLLFDSHLERRFSLSAAAAAEPGSVADGKPAAPAAGGASANGVPANWIYVESDVQIRRVVVTVSLVAGRFGLSGKTLVLVNPVNGWNLCVEGFPPRE